MKSSFYARCSIGIFAFFLFTTPTIISSAKRAVQHSANRVADWLPESFEATQRLHWFAEHFVADDLLMISWDGCTLDDSRIVALTELLRRPVDIGDDRQLTLARKIWTGPEVLDQLRAEPLELSRKAALIRMRGWLVGDDLKSTAIIVLMSTEGFQHRHAWVDHVYRCADEIPELGAESLRVAGTTMDSVAIDAASHKNLQLMMSACYFVGCVMMWLLFRNIALTGMVFVVALYCQELSLALVELTGGHMDSIMLTIPSLVYVLTISAGIHLANYYRDAVDLHGLKGATSLAVRQAALPCGLASVTTALGLGSLSVSFLNPVRNFGFYASLAVLSSTLVVFLMLPALFEHFANSKTTPSRRAESRTGDTGGWQRWKAWVEAHCGAIATVSMLALALSGWGVYRIQSSARVHDMFADDSTIIRDYDWMENRIGPLIPLEIIVRIPKVDGECQLTIMDRFRIVGAVHGKIAEHDAVGAVISPLNFAPQIKPRGTTAEDVSREALLNTELDNNRDTFVDMGFLRELPTEELWRISSRAYASHGLDYATLLAELQGAVQPVLQRVKDRGWGDVRAEYCGAVPLVQQAQAQMLKDLVNSFVLAFGLIGLMMIGLTLLSSYGEFAHLSSPSERVALALRRVVAGIVTMVPNVLPCLAVLGGMGLLGYRLEIGSLMTSSVALGIAVDDTLHFITWFRRGLAAGKSRSEAVGFAYSRCATAMTQTSLVCGLGLLTFAFSAFLPIARFAWLMFAMLGAALIADLIVLPAILLGPIGVVFAPVRPTPTSRTNPPLRPPRRDSRQSARVR